MVSSAKPDGHARRFAVAWRNPSRPAISPIGLLERHELGYSFAYLRAAGLVPGFRPLLSFPTLYRTYRSLVLFPFFSQRVMDPKRPEYQDYVRSLALPADADELDILGRAGGQRKGDHVQVLEAPKVAPDGHTTYVFLVRGVRHIAGAVEQRERALEQLRVNDELRLQPEPENPVNPRAVVIADTGGTRLGWVPDLLLPYVDAVQSTSQSRLSVERVNGPDLPGHLRLVARITGTAPVDFEPFTGSGWELASDDVVTNAALAGYPA